MALGGEADRPRPWVDARVDTNIGTPTFNISPDGQQLLTYVTPAEQLGRNSSVHVAFLLKFFDELKRRVRWQEHTRRIYFFA